jgi:acyl-CoA synthetase (AMP-forming)/AMP-acid ligase II
LRENVVGLVSQLHSLGLKRGERIAIAMTNGSPMAITFLAAALCGTAAPLNPKYKQEEFKFYYEDTQAKALITLSEGPEAAIVAVTPDMILINAKVNTDGTLSFELVKTVSEPAESLNLATPTADDMAMILHTSVLVCKPRPF